jgi:hypothetical protein
VADWTNISSLATGGGTLVLAIATFASVRSANRSARVAEQALQEQRRPVLAQSRLDDPVQKIGFVDGHWVSVGGGRAAVDLEDGNIYLAMSLRNVGSGIAVLQGWGVRAAENGMVGDHLPEAELRSQTRDLYVAGGDIGLWQGALRDPDHPHYAAVVDNVGRRERFIVELLYSDNEGGQRTVSMFIVNPIGDGEWLASVGRHWYLDRIGPR